MGGQAKRRGSYEERKAAAIKRNQELQLAIEKEPNPMQKEALKSFALRRGIQQLATVLISMNALHLPPKEQI